MTELQDLEMRIQKVEKSKESPARFFLQYLLSPLLLVIIGGLLNFQLEKAKQEFHKIELELKRIETTQKFMTELFSDNPQRALIAEKLISVIVDKKLANEIIDIVEKFYSQKLAESLANPKDLQKAEEIKAAAETLQTQAGKKILDKLKAESFSVIVGSFADQQNALNKAEVLRLKGYDSKIVKSKAGFYRVAIGKYNFDAAIEKRREAIGKGDFPSDAWILSQERLDQ
ncbi:MAG: SPOR domain-containing protein [Thermodesulfobacteriota bacterium]